MFSINDIKFEMIKYFGMDMRRINHALKVHSFACLISDSEPLDEEIRIIIETAALLHDIGIKNAEEKYHSSAGNYQEIEGPIVAENLLYPSAMDAKTKQRILYLIGHHHSYSKIDGIDFQILVESDFIVNCDEDAMTTEAIFAIKDKYFRTALGSKLMTTLFLHP